LEVAGGTQVTQSIQPASRAAGKGLGNSLLLDIAETEIYLDTSYVVALTERKGFLYVPFVPSYQGGTR
jgi:hypothetical protein